MHRAVNRGFGGIAGKPANVQLRVFRFNNVVLAGAAFLLARARAGAQPKEGLRLDSLSDIPSECHQRVDAAVQAKQGPRLLPRPAGRSRLGDFKHLLGRGPSPPPGLVAAVLFQLPVACAAGSRRSRSSARSAAAPRRGSRAAAAACRQDGVSEVSTKGIAFCSGVGANCPDTLLAQKSA